MTSKLGKIQNRDNSENKALNLIRYEINKVWKELKKTSTKEELNKLREDLKIEFRNNLRNELRKYATKDDLTKELSNYATKDDLYKSVQDLIEFIRITNDQTKKELREDIIQFKDDILSEIIKLRDDIAVVIGYRDMIDDHEVRIQKLEKKSPTN